MVIIIPWYFICLLIFGQVQSSIFVVVGLFFIFSIFGQTQSFSVDFNKLTFVIVIFWSCSKSYGSSVSVIFKLIFGHIDSVKLTSLGYRGRKKVEKFDRSKNFELPINLDSFVKAFFLLLVSYMKMPLQRNTPVT